VLTVLVAVSIKEEAQVARKSVNDISF
jgi:hypothetical protein